jgi:hypothetical protein
MRPGTKKKLSARSEFTKPPHLRSLSKVRSSRISMAPILFEKERMYLTLHYVVPKILKKVRHLPHTLIITILPFFT